MKTPWEHRQDKMITPWKKNNMKISVNSRDYPFIRSEGTSYCNRDRANILKDSRFSQKSSEKIKDSFSSSDNSA